MIGVLPADFYLRFFGGLGPTSIRPPVVAGLKASSTKLIMEGWSAGYPPKGGTPAVLKPTHTNAKIRSDQETYKNVSNYIKTRLRAITF